MKYKTASTTRKTYIGILVKANIIKTSNIVGIFVAKFNKLDPSRSIAIGIEKNMFGLTFSIDNATEYHIEDLMNSYSEILGTNFVEVREELSIEVIVEISNGVETIVQKNGFNYPKYLEMESEFFKYSPYTLEDLHIIENYDADHYKITSATTQVELAFDFQDIFHNLVVTDLDKSLEFYLIALGMLEIKRLDSKESTIVYVRTLHFKTTFKLTCYKDKKRPFTPLSIDNRISLYSTYYSQTHENHSKLKVLNPIKDDEESYYINDPDGNVIEILKKKLD
jgi:catechol 2,3-dioxygenase-like lactoylglutathione lyase family enzyme